MYRKYIISYIFHKQLIIHFVFLFHYDLFFLHTFSVISSKHCEIAKGGKIIMGRWVEELIIILMKPAEMYEIKWSAIEIWSCCWVMLENVMRIQFSIAWTVENNWINGVIKKWCLCILGNDYRNTSLSHK